MTELSREEVEDLARSQFESAMAFGVSLDNFVRLGIACYEAGAKSEREVLEQVAHNIASSPAKVLEESVLVGQSLNRLDRTQQALLAERSVSDRLLNHLHKIVDTDNAALAALADMGIPADPEIAALTIESEDLIAEVEAMRKEKPE